MSNKNSKSRSLKKYFHFIMDYYFNSNEKKKAWLLLSATLLSSAATTALFFGLAWWCFPMLYAAFIAQNVVTVCIGLAAGLGFAVAIAGFNYLANYLKNDLYIRWRSWLTKKLINQYLNGETNHLKLSRLHHSIKNPEQRIQEDVNQMIKSALALTLGSITNFANLTLAIVLLSLVGGSLSFALLGLNVVIPGFLVWVALAVGITTTVVGYLISRSMNKKTSDEINSQSELRADLLAVTNSSEEIAIEKAETYHLSRLEKDVDKLNVKTKKLLSLENRTSTYNMFNNTFQTLVPFVAAMPLYFTNLMSINVFYSVGYYFSMITRSLGWFMDSFKMINKFKTSTNRIMDLQEVLDKKEEPSTANNISRLNDAKERSLVIKNLNLHLHKNNKLIIKGLNLRFAPGVHTLIQAPSGVGKSSLFKAIAGTWLAGEGEIIIPKNQQSIYFLPQKPTLPADILRRVLAYPDNTCSYSDAELAAALKAVNLGHLIKQLDKLVGFKSLGEQQRIAFARVLLRKPDWVFLDEATASLDEESEEQVYSSLKKHLPNTTIISIAHRSTVKRYHDNVLFFKTNANKEVQVEENNLHEKMVSSN